ncbi:unnamed protein product [Ectocarpus sp. 8 AP-2014]
MPTSFKFLKGQRVRLSIGGADARHFHPIIPTPPGSRTASTGDAAASIPGRSTAAAPGGSASAAVGGESSSVVTRRVLRVHTGGAFASSISLPVPCRGDNDIVGAEQGSLRPGGEEGRLAAAQASNAAGASPTLPGRARSLSSIPRRLLSISGGSSLAEGEEGGDVVRRHRSEGRLQDFLGGLAPGAERPGGLSLFEE